MSKIRVVQMTMVASDNDTYSEYLDDKGRVWFPTGRWENQDDKFGGERKWITEWRQLELPEEPGDA
jgi:hypothetical protein